MRASRMELPHTALPLTVPIQTPLPQSHNVHADTLKVQEGRNGPMSRTAGRAMCGWGPRCAGRGTRCIQRERLPAQRGTPRSGRPRTAGGPAARGANTRMRWSERCVPKTFTLNSAVRAGRQGWGRGPRPATRSPAKQKESGLCPKESAKHRARRWGGPADDGHKLPQ